MGAIWAKNELTASLRTALVEIYELDGVTPADRAVDFTGYVYLGKSSTSLIAALGTIENIRRAHVQADVTIEATNIGTDVVQMTAHPYEKGDGPFRPDTTSGGLDTAVNIWIIIIDADHIAFADSLAHAYAGTKLNLTADVTGTKIQDTASTQRGLDGEFLFTATQAETDFTGCEALLVVDKPLTHARARTSVQMTGSGDGLWDAISEMGISYGDYERLKARTAGAKFSVVGNVITWRNFADTKDSHQGTVTEDGRISITIIDLSP